MFLTQCRAGGGDESSIEHLTTLLTLVQQIKH